MASTAVEALATNGLSPLLAVSMSAEPLAGFPKFITNSVLFAVIVTLVILWASRKATKQLRPVPSGFQNFFEFIIEFLYGQVEQIVGPKVAPKCFPLLATIFLFVLLSNWFGLIPGVGTIGFAHDAAGMKGPMTLDPAHHFSPLLRPPTADLNMTLGIALVFMLVWAWITYREIGVIGFIKHTFAPKGGLTGVLGALLVPIFLFVGVIELISIAFRPVSLSMRLYGNIYAGESLLHTMGALLDGASPVVAFIGKVLLPLPFYFMELLVGVLQATVFSLLCAVYIQLSTSHEEDH